MRKKKTKVLTPQATDVSLIVKGKSCEFNNGLIHLKFNEEAYIDYLNINSVNLVDNLGGNKSFYLDANGGAFRFLPESLIIKDNNENIAHVYYSQNNFHGLYVEYHIIMVKNISGIYTYIKVKNNTSQNIELSELRLVYRFNPNLMKSAFNGLIKKDLPTYKNLEKHPKIQDETWQLTDGTYYTKYDLAGYIRDTNYYGVYSPLYGAWIINSSHEYYSGGPLKQDLLVHQDSLMLNYLTSSHFGTPNLMCKPNWNKSYGPWLVYINNFQNEDNMFSDLSLQAYKEKNTWPYTWLKDDLYPLTRYSLTGRIKDNINATIVLTSSLEEEFDKQTLGYSYNTTSDENGFFSINNIRPSDYRLSVYPISGYNCEALLTNTVSLLNNNQDLGDFNILPEDTNIIWALSQTDRKSDSFKLSDENRNYVWQLHSPKNINFVVNESDPKEDWYYAQTKIGKWCVVFNDTPSTIKRILRVAFAATSSSSISRSTVPHLQILFNEKEIFNKTYDNDKTIYRSALNSGNFNYIKIDIDANDIIEGKNVITFSLIGGAIMYDSVIYSNNV